MNIKLFEQYIAEYVVKIPKIKITGIFYHGSIVGKDDDIFTNFNIGHYDWNAIWFASDEFIAEEFASWRGDWGDNSDEIKVCYKVSIKSTSIADITYELSQRIIEKWALNDLREAIDILSNKGYNGWKTTGGIDRHIYDDYAMFNLKGVKILEIKLFIDNEWTEYMSLEYAQNIIEERRNYEN